MARREKISYSQLEDGRCPYRYKKFRIDKEYRKVTNPGMARGLFVHAVVNAYVRHCVEKKVDGDHEFMEKLFKEKFEAYHIPESDYQELYDQLMDFGAKNVSFDNVLDTEKHFEIEFDQGKFIEGYIDITRVYLFRGIAKKDNEPILHIIDYKNQANILPADQTLTMQLKIYTLACTLMYPNYQYYRRGIYYTKYNFLRYAEPEEDPTPIDQIKIEVQDTREMLVREWGKLKGAKEYPAITGDHCYQYDGCPILLDGKCPCLKDKFDGIEETVRKCFQLDTQLKDLKKKVKSYITANGNVTVDGKEVGFIEKDTEDYPFEGMLKICRDSGYSFDDKDFPKTFLNDFEKSIKGRITEHDIKKKMEKIVVNGKSTSFKLI